MRRIDEAWRTAARAGVGVRGAGAESPLVARFRGLVRGAGAGVRIREGSMRDYERLAALHYRGACPATVEKVIVADAPGAGVVGVLVVSRPTLNGRWRVAAWPGRYSGPDRRRNAAGLNAEVRTISRVVVDPRFRGVGVARGLVEAYLAAPLTVRTEAVAAMGACCPLFEAAGMRAWRLGPTERDRRLRRAMRAAGVSVAALIGASGRGLGGKAMGRALRVWADASRATRGMKRGPVREIARAAASALVAPRVAYTFERSATGTRAGNRAEGGCAAA